MKLIFMLLLMLVVLTGCVDFSKANWFGCPKGELLRPTSRKMFGQVRDNAHCLKPGDTYYSYWEEYYKEQETKP